MKKNVVIALSISLGIQMVYAGASIRPAEKPNLTVICEPGGILRFDPPEIRTAERIATLPHHHYADWFESWQPWPKKGKDKKACTIELSPSHDEDNVPILGGLYRAFQADTLEVASADGTKTFTQDQDFKFNADWGQVAALTGRLGEPGAGEVKVSCRYALQRLDLVQMLPDGKLVVKKGKSSWVCPQLPEPDKGAAPLAGIYIAPWRVLDNPHFAKDAAPEAEMAYAVTQYEIFPIQPVPPAAPANPDAVVRTLEKLRAGKPVSIAFMGASVTLGAEAGAWWENQFTEKDMAYRGRVVLELRKRFPQSKITPVEAYRGGTTMPYALKVFEEIVEPAHPDLMLVCFGANDASGAVGKGPNNPPEAFREQLVSLVRRAKENNIGVVIVAGSQMNPWLPNGAAQRQPEYNRIMREAARRENTALADVYTEWLNLSSHGIPPFTQLHNWINHPGILGHKVYADTILRLFPEER